MNSAEAAEDGPTDSDTDAFFKAGIESMNAFCRTVTFVEPPISMTRCSVYEAPISFINFYLSLKEQASI